MLHEVAVRGPDMPFVLLKEQKRMVLQALLDTNTLTVVAVD